jgi:hypothetical protein
MTTVLLANATVASASTRVSVAGPSKAHPARAATPPARVAPRPSNSSCAFLARAARLRAATVARAGRAPGGGAERMGDDEVRRGPPGAERDPYRAPEGYEYDYAPPRGGPNGSSPWETAGAGFPPRAPPGSNQGGDGGGGGNRVTNFLIAGAFIIGMGAGVAFDTSVDLEPSNVASREILDRQTPSSEVCMANGASAMVFDQRVFMSLNPFNIYVSQPEVKPGCVLRRSNWSILEREKLVTDNQESDCKRGMNTFAFVGDLDKSPEVSCVYHSEEAENQFMRDPKGSVMGDGNQVREYRKNKSFR